MKFNSDAAVAQARRDLQQYGSWFDLLAATERREDGVRVLPARAPAADSLALAGANKTKRPT